MELRGSGNACVLINCKDVQRLTLEDLVLRAQNDPNDTAIIIDGENESNLRNLIIYAAYPMIIGGIDQFSFENINMYSLDNLNPLISVRAGSIVSNLSFYGHQIWIGGSHGFHLDNTGDVQGNFGNLLFQNIRRENNTDPNDDASGYAIYIDTGGAASICDNVCVQNIRAGTISPAMNGIYARHVRTLSLFNCFLPAPIALNVDSECENVYLINSLIETSAISLNGLTQIFSTQIGGMSSWEPSFAHYGTVTNPTGQGIHIYGTNIFSTEQTLADDGSYNLPVPNGWELAHIHVISEDDPNDVWTSEGGNWIVSTHHSAVSVKISGTTNTAISDVDGNLCVYKSGGTLKPLIKNRLGQERKFLINAFII